MCFSIRDPFICERGKPVCEGRGRFENRRNRYADWRGSGPASFHFSPLPIDLSPVPQEHRKAVRERCVADYRKSSERYDQAIADAALRYVHEEGDPAQGPGPLSRQAELFSSRMMDLYEMWVMYEKDRGIPMLPLDAGCLKEHGFIAEEILRMQGSCAGLMGILSGLRRELSAEEYERFFLDLTSEEGRRKGSGNPLCREAIQRYEALPEKGLIDRACSIMCDYGQGGLQGIERQLHEVAVMQPLPDADLEERLLMEIRHRVAEDGINAVTSPGSLGTNPMAYWNIVRRGNPANRLAEFRGRLYFVYVNGPFINACMQDAQFIAFANQRLKGWKIDPEFVQAMNDREPKFLPPVFRYGPYALLSSQIRQKGFNPEFSREYPNPELGAVLSGRASLNASFRHPLSPTELLAIEGDFDPSAVRLFRQVPFESGGSLYRIRNEEEISDTPKGKKGKEYLAMCKELGLPQLSSISGTFDYVAAMAGFVGVDELQTLKLSMIGFMVPCRDHSVQEICISARTYGLEFEPGPGFERGIYPGGGSSFLSRIDEERQRRGDLPPAYFLSAAHTHEVFLKLIGGSGNG